MEETTNTKKTGEIPLLLQQQPRIIFGMTARQFLIIVITLLLCFSWCEALQPQTLPQMIGFGSLCLLFSTIGLTIAFLSIGGRPLEEWTLLFLLWAFTPEYLKASQFLRMFMKIIKIEQGIVTLRLGRNHMYQTILRIEGGKQLDLLDEEAQKQVKLGFEQLLAGLSYPISLHIRVTPSSIPLPTLLPQMSTKHLRYCYAYYLSWYSQLIQQYPTFSLTYYLSIPTD